MAQVREVISRESSLESTPPPKRDRTHINAEILEICISGAKKTRIVYQANINFKMLVAYLKRLTDVGLLESMGDHYYTTDAGREYIYHVDELIT